MKCAYISYLDSKNKSSGIVKKIEGQIDGLNQVDIETDYITFDGDYLRCNNKELMKINDEKKHRAIFRELCKVEKIFWEKYDFIYIRFSYLNINLFKFIKHIHKQNIKVYLEIPTYPYKYEISNCIKRNIIDTGDKILFYKNKKYIEKIITTSKENEIFGIKTIKIFNGINTKKIVDKGIRFEDGGKINLVGMANLNRWHGYDRLIKGFEGVDNLKITFYVIGDGPERENLEKISKNLNIENRIKFLGEKNGTELEEILDKMHIAVSSLGLHRIGGAGDPIKTKEFLAKGFPVILGYDDIAIKEDKKYIYKVKADESRIDVNEILRWYDENKFEREEIITFAMKNLGWDSQMIKVKMDYENTIQ